MSWDQWLVLLAGVAAIFVSQDPRLTVQRWSPVLGMISQPGWIWAAWSASQLGNLLVSVLITVAWARGIWTYWIAPRLRRGRRCDQWIEFKDPDRTPR